MSNVIAERENLVFVNDLQKRLFFFAVSVIKNFRKLPKGKEFDVLSYQLIKASTSVGANYEEAQGAVSKADFANKIGIALKEIRESNYWIRLLIEITQANDEWLSLKKESQELSHILGSISAKTSTNRVL